MKKTLAILFAVMMMVFAVVPASALESPTTAFGYDVQIMPCVGSNGTYTFETYVDEDGFSHVKLIAEPDSGYEFDRWEIEGNYKLNGELTDAVLDITVKSDIVATPFFKKAGSTSPSQDTTVDVDDSSTSPQTGSNNFAVYAFGAYAIIACCLGAIKLVKKSNSKSK